ncbi:MAG: dephospho-CoA kinase [Desulfatitalea sp.]|nr:dephospho-CoA kinase [Desulfatitalea sp.]NNK00502.1 dephospho-CoA kinase [Desulfatitalea sp.]
MGDQKQLWLLAGGNGSGKSTFYQHYLADSGIKFVNADLIAKEIDPKNPEKSSYDAAAIVETIRNELLDQGASFCFETVFSHPSKIDFIAKAKSLGYRVILVYIHLFDPSLNEARVHQRTTEGGHGVPPDKIHSRIPRTIKHIKTALTIVDAAWILDNSSEKDRFRQIVVMENGAFEMRADPVPAWAKQLIS